MVCNRKGRNWDDYVNLAVQLSRRPRLLDRIHRRVDTQKEESVLFDTPRYRCQSGALLCVINADLLQLGQKMGNCAHTVVDC